MKKATKALSVLRLVSVAVAFALLFSAGFLIAEADHECIGEDCPICYQASLCHNAVRFPAILAAAVFALLSVALAVFCFEEKQERRISLVSLKVKLSD